jgi:hypothetical protein
VLRTATPTAVCLQWIPPCLLHVVHTSAFNQTFLAPDMLSVSCFRSTCALCAAAYGPWAMQLIVWALPLPGAAAATLMPAAARSWRSACQNRLQGIQACLQLLPGLD